MSFLQDAQIMIPEITGVALTVFGRSVEAYRTFEKKFCFASLYQPLYTEKGLRSFFEEKSAANVCHITDALETKILLANCGAQENILMSYKMYRCSLPLVAQAGMRSIALMMVSNTETIVPLNPVQIKLDVKKSEDLPVQILPAFSNEQTVNQNYAWELQIMEAE